MEGLMTNNSNEEDYNMSSNNEVLYFSVNQDQK